MSDVCTDIALMRLYNDDTPYVIVDVTEVKRPQAKRTKFVGVLKEGQTLGFDLLMLAAPYRGSALPTSRRNSAITAFPSPRRTNAATI